MCVDGAIDVFCCARAHDARLTGVRFVQQTLDRLRRFEYNQHLIRLYVSHASSTAVYFDSHHHALFRNKIFRHGMSKITVY